MKERQRQAKLGEFITSKPVMWETLWSSSNWQRHANKWEYQWWLLRAQERGGACFEPLMSLGPQAGSGRGNRDPTRHQGSKALTDQWWTQASIPYRQGPEQDLLQLLCQEGYKNLLHVPLLASVPKAPLFPSASLLWGRKGPRLDFSSIKALLYSFLQLAKVQKSYWGNIITQQIQKFLNL